jgi:hypothetical protein
MRVEVNIRAFIKSASVNELIFYKELLLKNGGFNDIVDLISFILERVDKLD